MTDAEWAVIAPMAIRRGTAENALDAAKQALQDAYIATPVNLRAIVESTIEVQRAKEELDTANSVLKTKIQTLFKLQVT